jgi:hypothetical protein
MNMRVSTAARWAEGLAAGLVIGLAGILRPEDPSFSGFSFMPQVLGAVLVSSLLGVGPGACAIAGSCIAFLALPPAAGLLGVGLAAAPERLLEAARLPAAAAVAAVCAAGWMRDGAERVRRKLLDRVKDLTRRLVKMRKVGEALSTVCEELELRVSSQRDSISALYAHMKKMDSHELDRVLDGLLGAVQAFSQASAAAVYEYDQSIGALVLAARLGPEPPASLPLAGSIEGWVFRNDATFSLRMLEERPYLARLDEGRSVLAFPLKAGDLPWGMLNIGEMPFYRYNPVTEKNLGIVVGLSSSYIKKAVDYRDRERARPRHTITGLPGYEELMLALGNELKRRAPRRLSVSIVLVELLGFEALRASRADEAAFALLREFSVAAGRRDSTYHFREEGQLAFLLPDVDRDGASIFCLDLAERMERRPWNIGGEPLRLDLAFGIGSFPGTASKQAVETKSAAGITSEITAEAESVLALSRRAYDERGEAPA